MATVRFVVVLLPALLVGCLPTSPALQQTTPPVGAVTATAPSLVATPTIAPTVRELPADSVVVYTDVTGVWALEPVGGPRQLAAMPSTGSPLISPTRRWVAFQTSTWVTDTFTAALWIVPYAGGEPRRLLATGDLRQPDDPYGPGYLEEVRWVYGMQWLPNEDTLMLNTSLFGGMGGLPEGLWTIDPGSGTLRQCLDLQAGGWFIVSPDGQWVVVAHTGYESPRAGTASWAPTDATIWASRPDGTDRRMLLRHPRMSTDSSWSIHAAPVWLPDSRHLLVATWAPEQDGDAWLWGDSDIVLYELVIDGPAKQIGRLSRGSNEYDRPFPNAWWSPDGQRLAYVAPPAVEPTIEPTSSLATAYPPPPAAGEFADLVIADQNGGGGRVYATMPWLRFHTWARDGRHFRFEGDGQIWIGAEGEPPVALPGLDMRGVASVEVPWTTDDGRPAPEIVVVGEDGSRMPVPAGATGIDVAAATPPDGR